MSEEKEIHPVLKPENNGANASPLAHGGERADSVHVTLEFNIDLLLLRRQKRALISLYEGAQVSPEQEDAAEGMLNLIDFIQDSILDQGLATEQEISARLPNLFEAA